MKLCNLLFQVLSYAKNNIQREIASITEISQNHFTPEIKLHLITPRCKLWYEPPEKCPIPDPFWAFFWPGGQAMTRFLWENSSIIHNKNVLDIGCGCGATAIACHLNGAKNVTANDVDTNALEAVKMNLTINTSQKMLDLTTQSHPKLNKTFFLSDKNYLTLDERTSDHIDVISFGDMFYDEETVDLIFKWISVRTKMFPQTRIFLGDPGRGFIEQHQISKYLKTQCVYEMPDCVQEEHYNCASVSVLEWKSPL